MCAFMCRGSEGTTRANGFMCEGSKSTEIYIYIHGLMHAIRQLWPCSCTASREAAAPAPPHRPTWAHGGSYAAPSPEGCRARPPCAPTEHTSPCPPEVSTHNALRRQLQWCVCDSIPTCTDRTSRANHASIVYAQVVGDQRTCGAPNTPPNKARTMPPITSRSVLLSSM